MFHLLLFTKWSNLWRNKCVTACAKRKRPPLVRGHHWSPASITRQKFAKSGNRESRSRNIIDGSFELPSSSCMHDPSFMSLAFIVLGKMTSTQKLDKSLHRRRRRRQHREDNTYVSLRLRRREKNLDFNLLWR